jgi:hypothetical protein
MNLRILVLGTALFAFALSPFAVAAGYRDWWRDPPKDGTDIMIGRDGARIFGAWYLNSASDTDSYLSFTGRIRDNVMSAPLYRHAGSPILQKSTTAATGARIGTMTVTFTSGKTATFAYAFDGGAGTLNLSGFADASLSVADSCNLGSNAAIRSCINSASSEMKYVPGPVAASANDEVHFAHSPEGCTYYDSLMQSGTEALFPPSISCRSLQSTIDLSTIFLNDTFASTEIGRPSPDSVCVFAGGMAVTQK